MISRLSKALILGFSTGMVGLVVCLMPFALDLEENIGLDLLFRLRGVRQPPSDVIVVSVDKTSADSLNLPADLRKWPRSLHARLIENLMKEGAAVIAFDFLFSDPHSSKEDSLLAEAMSAARNVVLFEYLKSENVSLIDNKESLAGDLSIVKIVPPIPILAQSAVSSAPFPLPKVPVKVSQYWKFRTGAGDTPTLPVVVFQIFAMQVYDEFIYLLEKVSPYRAGKLPHDKDAILTTKSVEEVIRGVRDIFENEPQTAKRMLEELENLKTLSIDVKKYHMIKSFIKMYQSVNSQYLNFYGPPRTITTLPYYQILQLREKAVGNKQQLDIKGKAVFVGISEILLAQKDGFYTVFSQPNGMDISGVEIAATAFANLIEDMPVRPVDFRAELAIIFIWGTVIGIFCRKFPAVIAALSVIGLSILYLIIAEYQFKTSGIWSPLVVPLFLQAPFAFFTSVIWKYFDSLLMVKNLSNEIIQRLTKASEYRDDDTGTHISRIGLYSNKIAEAMNMSPDFVETITFAGPMHDVGKIGIPDSILLKPGKLTSEEFKILKSHTIIGETILLGSTFPKIQMSASIALNHHERWDGSGYPKGLKGEEIPVEAQIINICDIYDALRSKRPYKPAFDHQKAFRIITEGDSRTMPEHFKPDVLAAFVKVSPIFEEIFSKHQD
jgi:HD-GYP domain-containing protein (c-di-GMP phosphodiesterase class II)